MKHYLKYYFLALIGTFISFSIYLSFNKNIFSSNIILSLGCEEFYLLKAGIFDFIERYFPLLLFQVFFGTYIYRHFCSASIYYFSRCSNRIKWILKEAGILYINTLIYILVMIITAFGTVAITNNIKFDNTTIILIVYYILITSLYVFFTTLLINILSFKLSSVAGFAIVQCTQLAFIVSLCLMENKILVNFDNGPEDSKYLIFNPMAHLVMKFHSSNNQALNKVINRYNTVFDINISVILFFCLSIITLLIGCVVVNKHSFIVSNNESEVF